MSIYSYIQDLLDSPQLPNSKKNIIAGPGNTYWNHSRGLEQPETREEGPWPIMGNIGILLKHELNNYAKCSDNISISGGPNCSGVFVPDAYTTSNTCKENCKLQAPDAFGMKDFGMNSDKLTNTHTLHAFKNMRAATEGKGPSSSYGCKEWIPAMKNTSGDSCALDYSTWGNTSRDFTKLDNNFTNYKYK